MTEKERKESARKLGKIGGETFRDKYGKEGFKKLGEMSYKARIKNDPGFYARFSAAGIHTREVKKQAMIAKEIGEIGNNSVLTTFTRFLSGK